MTDPSASGACMPPNGSRYDPPRRARGAGPLSVIVRHDFYQMFHQQPCGIRPTREKVFQRGLLLWYIH